MTTAYSEISTILASGHPDEVIGLINQGIEENVLVARERVKPYGAVASVAEGLHSQLFEQAGSHRVRGLLTILGFKLMGGTDDEMIVRAAVSGELNQAGVLPLDDIQDDSKQRRSLPALHRSLGWLYERETGNKADAAKAGESLTTNLSIRKLFEAQEIIIRLDAPPERRLAALSVINQNMAITGFGQNLDILLSKGPPANEAAIRQVMLAKTAIYTVLNPLQVGMALAGASSQSLKAVRGYAENIGTAFQILNDLDVTKPNTPESPKDTAEDILGGKQTLLTFFALSHPDSRATAKEQNFLARRLRGSKLSKRQFVKCQRILRTSGAVDYALAEIKHHAAVAGDSLQSAADSNGWNPNAVKALGYFTSKLAAAA